MWFKDILRALKHQFTNPEEPYNYPKDYPKNWDDLEWEEVIPPPDAAIEGLCPWCGSKIEPMWSGEKCSNEKCDYWFQNPEVTEYDDEAEN